MPDLPELRTEGPHSPDYTRQVADALAEAVRVLNYATMPGTGGLELPEDAYKLLANLYLATGRLPQLLAQVAAFLLAQAERGRLGDDNGRDPALVADLAALKLEVARARASDLTSNLQAAQNVIASLRVAGRSDA